MPGFVITSSVVLRNGIAIKDGVVFYEHPGVDASAFAKELYKKLGTDYSKFYKMDLLCKLSFVSAELLLKNNSIAEYRPEDVALVFSNASASLDTDKTYFRSVENKDNYFPSPAVFVYTLPNIMMGEICIRHKLLGENTFFVSEKFDEILLAEYAQTLLDSRKAKAAIIAWVEINDKVWEAIMFLVEKGDKKNEILSSTILQDVYKKV